VSATAGATSAGKAAAWTISAAFAASTPEIGSTGTLASASGAAAATSSMSIPPCTLAIARKLRWVRSRMNER
jgi:hypothetical protein